MSSSGATARSGSAEPRSCRRDSRRERRAPARRGRTRGAPVVHVRGSAREPHRRHDHRDLPVFWIGISSFKPRDEIISSADSQRSAGQLDVGQLPQRHHGQQLRVPDVVQELDHDCDPDDDRRRLPLRDGGRMRSRAIASPGTDRRSTRSSSRRCSRPRSSSFRSTHDHEPRSAQQPDWAVLAYSTVAVPFCIWMLKGYFDTIPISLEEAGADRRVDAVRHVLAHRAAAVDCPGLAVTCFYYVHHGVERGRVREHRPHLAGEVHAAGRPADLRLPVPTRRGRSSPPARCS